MAPSISTALFGKTQRVLLALFFGRPEQSFYLRQIVRLTGIGQGAAQRELARWVAAGLLCRSRLGNQVHYRANTDSPVFAELKAITLKTAGLTDTLCRALAPLAGQIRAAFVHGSVASGKETAASDIDLIVVGSTSFVDLVEALQPAQQALGREINPTLYDVREFREKLEAGDHFLKTIMKRPLLPLMGELGDLGGLGT